MLYNIREIRSSLVQRVIWRVGEWAPASGTGRYVYGADVRGILGLRDFTENLQKTLVDSFSNANKKPSKNTKKTLRRPQKF